MSLTNFEQAVYQGDGWLGIGFSDSGNMPGSDAVIGLPDEGTALEYDMDDYSTPVESVEQVCLCVCVCVCLCCGSEPRIV